RPPQPNSTAATAAPRASARGIVIVPRYLFRGRSGRALPSFLDPVPFGSPRHGWYRTPLAEPRMNVSPTPHLPDHLDWTLETDLRCTHDLEGRLLSVSAAAAHALGYASTALLKIPLSDLVVPEYRAEVPEYLDSIRRDGVANGLLALQTSNGHRRVWKYHNSLSAGPTPVVIGAARDVTERIRNKQALRASEDRFATAFYASPMAMAITTVAEGLYIDVNEAFERQTG